MKTYLKIVLLFSSCWLLVIYNSGTAQPALLAQPCIDIIVPDDRRLENILDAPPTVDKTIFFHETSCSSDGVVRLNAREACAIESAAVQNPDREVYVLYAADVGYRNTSSPLPLIDAITSYTNVKLRYVNITEYAQDTPLEMWILKRKLYESIYPIEHFADVLRFLTLFKFGGMHLDLDVVVKSSFNPLQSNYAGAESKYFVAVGVLNFEHTGIGHIITEMILRDLSTHFDGSKWSDSGPGVITRILNKICQTNNTEEMDRSRCLGFNVYPIEYFYAVEFNHYRYFFEENHLDEVMATVEKSPLTHVWNKFTKTLQVKVGSNVAYGVLAEQYCPKVYKASGEYF